MENYNIKKYKIRTHKIVVVLLFVLICLIASIFFFIAVNFDNDKSCHIDGGIWNEEKSRCEDQYGNKWKF